MKAIGSTALRAGLPASILALACVSTAGSAAAQSRYDGSWSVAISTHRGACPSGLRYGMQILNGQVVSAAGGVADVRGSVNPGGAVRVSVQSGGQWANVSGHLGVATGGGVWRLARPRQYRRLLGNLVGAADDVASGGGPNAGNADLQLRAELCAS